jgi:hypothetical protein
MHPWYRLTPYGFANSLGDVIRAAARLWRQSREERSAQATHARPTAAARRATAADADRPRGEQIGPAFGGVEWRREPTRRGG